MTNAEIEDIAGRVLASTLGPRGLDHIEIRAEHDEIDGPALFVDAFMKPEVPAVGGGIASGALHALSNALLEAGEARFPYLRVRYLGEDDADGGRAGDS